jgi:hypothetical protein
VSGIVPESWLIRNIIPICKNKGDSNDPKNFLPITIVSCLGKLFTVVLTEQLNRYHNLVDLTPLHLDLANQLQYRLMELYLSF